MAMPKMRQALSSDSNSSLESRSLFFVALPQKTSNHYLPVIRMVDPLSMTSLGLTICQGLISAYGAWKDFDSDISNTCRVVEDLARTLEELEVHIRSSSLVHADVISVQKCMEGCYSGLQSLDTALNRIKGAHIATGPKSKAWLKLQHALYPFKKDILSNLQGTVASLQGRLNFALQVYQT